MAHTISGIFRNTRYAGKAIKDLSKRDFTDEITVITKNSTDGEVSTHLVFEDIQERTFRGMVAGGVVGCMFGLLAAIVTIIIPGVQTNIVTGPLVTLFGILGLFIGSAAGGILTWIKYESDTDKKTQSFHDEVGVGEVMVIASTKHKDESSIKRILRKYNVFDKSVKHQAAF